MDPEHSAPLTIDEWRKKTADLARKVADNIDNVMAGKGFDSINTLAALKNRLAQLDSLGIKPDNNEFDEKIGVLNTQKGDNVNTNVIREVAEYLSPSESKPK